MTKRPTISLCCILKNEAKNLARFLESIHGCFDEIHLTDTGSTDGSVEMIAKWVAGPNPSGTEIHLHHFTWVDDFAAARNYSFSHATGDYVMWLDLDDVLGNPEAFRYWRDTAMALADFWLATYHYASDEKGHPLCSFARERVVKRSLDLSWKYFVHEGIIPSIKEGQKPLTLQYASTWNVIHKRDAEDVLQDRSRNLRLFEENAGKLDARMRYYYGKELFENQKPLDAFGQLMAAISDTTLEPHDRVMGIQYACMAAMAIDQWEKAIQLAHQGLFLSPQRAEFFVIIGDSLLRQNKLGDAVPFYNAAIKCSFSGDNPIQGPIFQHAASYRSYPLLQLTRIYASSGDFLTAEKYLADAMVAGITPETAGMKKELDAIRALTDGIVGKDRKPSGDIIITCPPHGLYLWDHNVYSEKGVGGSETAAVEMSTWLSRLTGRKVIIFNPREKRAQFGKVEYRPSGDLPEYLKENKPAAHIAWRHGLKLSEDPMHVWAHDLGCQGLENPSHYHKVFALSDFHKTYLKNFFGCPDEKIIVTRNGVEPKRFSSRIRRAKEFGKIVYSSSPDRGLDRAIRIIDEVVKTYPQAKLHVYYGFDNMLKMGMKAEVERLGKMMDGKPHIVFHGNLPQDQLTDELESACIWLYPTNFLETYCITAIEMLCAGVFPIVRRWGALQNTLAEAEKSGMAALLDCEGESPEDVKHYSYIVAGALKAKAWERVDVDPTDYSWKSIAEEWVPLLGLGENECQPRQLSSSSLK